MSGAARRMGGPIWVIVTVAAAIGVNASDGRADRLAPAGRPPFGGLAGHRRSTLQAGASLPKAEACTEALAAPLLLNAGCQEAMMGKPNEGCCQALERMVGPGAGRGTADCLCDGPVWWQVAYETDQLGIHIQKVLDVCNSEMGTSMHYFEGTGASKCSETSPSPSPSPVPSRPAPSILPPLQVATGPKKESPSKPAKKDSATKSPKKVSPAKSPKKESPAKPPEKDPPSKLPKKDPLPKSPKKGSPAKPPKKDVPLKPQKKEAPLKAQTKASSPPSTQAPSIPLWGDSPSPPPTPVRTAPPPPSPVRAPPPPPPPPPAQTPTPTLEPTAEATRESTAEATQSRASAAATPRSIRTPPSASTPDLAQESAVASTQQSAPAATQEATLATTQEPTPDSTATILSVATQEPTASRPAFTPGMPLPLPANPGQECAVSELAGPLLLAPVCQDAVMMGKATEGCCGALETALGPEATGATRDCLCVQSVWEEVVAITGKLGAPIQRVLDECNSRLGARVPYFQGPGVGLCAGGPHSPQSALLSFDPPENPGEVCTESAIFSPMGDDSCQGRISGSSAEEECCLAFDRVLGATSAESTRNCMCDRSVREAAWEIYGALGIPMGDVWDECNAKYGTNIGFYEGPGIGKCSGDDVSLSSDYYRKGSGLEMRGFGDWMRDLRNEPAVLVSFIFAFPTSLGVALFFVVASQALLF